MVVNSPTLQEQPMHTQIWPLIPMLINRTLEFICFLAGHAFPLFSLMQMPLSLMALGIFIKVSECTAVPALAPPPSTAAAMAAAVAVTGPRPFCSAPIILAAILMVIEIVIFLLVLFITQTHREHQIMMLTQRIMDADVEAGRSMRDRAHVPPLSAAMQESTVKYCTVLQPCGRDIMVAVPELLQPAATTPKTPVSSIPISSPQVPGSYPPTALQLSLLAYEAGLLPAGQTEGHLREIGVVNPGSPGAHEAAAAPAVEAAAAPVSTSQEAAAASPGARRPVFEIEVDATGASAGMAVALVRCCEDEGSARSVPAQLTADISNDVSGPRKDVLEGGQCPFAEDASTHSAGSEDATKCRGCDGTAARSVAEESVSAAAALREAPANGDDLQVSGSLQR
ncbi:hypothetical protein COCOBI_10-1280 [Coccomyxa sp. Obi]|nr:hypothetical protein COCOBI_10-1280 [Coccomyxa sp. Obi]